MNEVERWIHGEGPAPSGIREMLDASRRRARVRGRDELTPELEAELDRRVFTAIAAQRAKWARERRVKIGLVAGVLVAGAAAALALALHAGAGFVHEAAPSAIDGSIDQVTR